MSANANKERRLPAGWCAAEDYSVSNRGLRTGLVGTPEQIAERLDALERIGIDLTLLQFSPQAEEMERFAEEGDCGTWRHGSFPQSIGDHRRISRAAAVPPQFVALAAADSRVGSGEVTQSRSS